MTSLVVEFGETECFAQVRAAVEGVGNDDPVELAQPPHVLALEEGDSFRAIKHSTCDLLEESEDSRSIPGGRFLGRRLPIMQRRRFWIMRIPAGVSNGRHTRHLDRIGEPRVSPKDLDQSHLVQLAQLYDLAALEESRLLRRCEGPASRLLPCRKNHFSVAARHASGQ